MAEQLNISSTEAVEYFFDRGWTDGLPIVPPTPDLVEKLLGVVDLAPDAVLGSVPERDRHLTAEKAAINSVMAGCKPEYFPLVVAALEAILDPEFNAHAAMSSTGGAALCLIVSGPLVKEHGFFHLNNALGSGNRANASIGRAVRLVAMNVFGAQTGVMDASSIGHPGKYSMVLAETTPPTGWPTFAEELGAPAGSTSVTVIAAEGPRQIANHLNPDPKGWLLTIASAMRCPATFTVGKGAQVVVVLGYEARESLARDGWSKDEIRSFLAEHSRISAEELEAAGVLLELDSAHNMVPEEDGLLPSVSSPDDIFVITAGGAGAGWSAYMPAWAPIQHSRATSRLVTKAGHSEIIGGKDV
jgi:hypothetical protein